MTTYTQEYLDGIKEGRQTLKAFERDQGRSILREEAEEFLDVVCRALARGYGKEVSDMFRGERDFWKGQLKRL